MRGRSRRTKVEQRREHEGGDKREKRQEQGPRYEFHDMLITVLSTEYKKGFAKV